MSASLLRGARAVLVATVLIPLFAPGVAHASWTSAGIEGGGPHTIAANPANPSIVFAAARAGLFKTVDAGDHWTRVDLGTGVGGSGAPAPMPDVVAMAIAPSSPNVIYVALADDSVLRSDDSGETWERVDGVPVVGASEQVAALAVDPHDPDAVVAGTNGLDGFYRTSTGGRALADRPGWAHPHTNLKEVKAFAIDPFHTDVIYAATKGGIWKTENGGATWVTKDNGAPLSSRNVAWIVIDEESRTTSGPARATTLLFADVMNGVFKTTDAGENWHSVNTGLTRGGSAVGGDRLAVDPTDSDHLLVTSGTGDTLYETTDGAQTWTEVPGAPDFHGRYTALELTRDGAFLGDTGPGILRRDGDAGPWIVRSTGFVATNVVALAALPADPETLLAGVEYGLPRGTDMAVYRSTDGADTWTRLASAPSLANLTSAAGAPAALAFDPRDPDIIHLARANGSLANEGVWRTLDGGATWRFVSFGRADAVHRIVVDPSRPQNVYALIKEGAGGLMVSADLGQTWAERSATERRTSDLVVREQADQWRVIVSTPRGVYRSVDSPDGKLTFEAVGPATAATALATTRDGASLYAAFSTGLQRSDDGGSTWASVSADVSVKNAARLIVDPDHAEVAYALTTKGAVVGSTASGAVWVPLAAGLRGKVQALLHRGTGPAARLVAGTDTSGVFTDRSLVPAPPTGGGGGGGWLPPAPVAPAPVILPPPTPYVPPAAVPLPAEPAPVVVPKPAVVPDRVAPRMLVGAGPLVIRAGRTAVRVTCPRSELRGCAGTVTLRTRRGRVVATAPFRVARGATRVVALRLTRPGRAAVQTLRPRSLRVVVAAHDYSGNRGTVALLRSYRLR